MSNVFADVRSLVSLKYFYESRDGLLHLRDDVAESIIDSHTHIGWGIVNREVSSLGDTIFPHQGFQIDLDQYSAYDYSKKLKKRATSKTVAAILSKGKNKKTSASHLLLEMECLNVCKAALMAVDIFGSVNSKIVLNTYKHDSEHFIPFISLHPKNKHNKEILSKYIKKGAVGIKVHPSMQRVSPSSRYIKGISELAQENKMPILFHCGHSPLTPKSMKKFTKMGDYRKIVEAYPDVTYILGHSGIDDWEEAMKIARDNSNVYLELSGQPPEVIKKFIKVLGSDRLLFGSDWPYYPIALPLSKVLLATEGDEKSRQNVLFNNADKLFRK